MADYVLPPLPYDFAALEPYIDAKTMEIHHDKHHAAYVNNLNAALKDLPEHQGKPIEELIQNLAALPESVRGAVRNNGGGHWNHSFFWKVLTAPSNTNGPSAELKAAIDAAFGACLCEVVA